MEPQRSPSTAIETVAELRELYRASESRAARMRLLSVSGRDLALAEADTIASVIKSCADRLAHFLGRPRAIVSEPACGVGLAIPAPGPGRTPLGWLDIQGVGALDDIPDPEDRDASRLLLELMGATLSRIEEERERARLLSALRDREQRLEYVVGRLFSAQEDERRRLSHELHDGVAQTATALMRMLEGASDEAKAPTETARLAQIARDLVTEVRSIIGGLRPTLLDDLGLEAAITSLGDSLEREGFDVQMTLKLSAYSLPSAIETALFRVAQEAVTNVRRHAGGPCRVELTLESDNVRGTCLTIRDHGRGVVNTPNPQGLDLNGSHVGLEIMRERMIAVGGTFNWQGDRHGVAITARLPVAQ